jgi:O-antigen/teichoic acid export membrane protein
MAVDKSESSENETDRIISGSLAVFAGKISARGFRFLIEVLLARGFGPTGYGIYTICLTLVNIGKQGSLLGFQNVFVKFYTTYEQEDRYGAIKGTIVTTFAVTLSLSLLVAMVLSVGGDTIATRFFNDPSIGPKMAIFALVLPAYAMIAIATNYIQALRHMRAFAVLNAPLLHGLNLLAVVAVIIAGATLSTVFGALVLSGIVAAAVTLLYFLVAIPPAVTKATTEFELKRLFGFTLPIFLAGFANLFMTQIDRLMVGYFLPSAAVGVFSMAALFSRQIIVVLGAMNSSFAPVISEAYAAGELDRLDELYEATTRYVIGATVIGALPLLVFAEDILRLINPAYSGGAQTLVILAIGYLSVATAGAAGYVLQLSDNERLVLVNHVGMVFVNVALNLLLIPRYGIDGAALATMTTLLVVNLLRLVEVWVLLGMYPYSRKAGKFAVGFAVALLIGIGLRSLPNEPLTVVQWAPLAVLTTASYGAFVLLWGLESDEKAALAKLPYLDRLLDR